MREKKKVVEKVAHAHLSLRKKQKMLYIQKYINWASRQRRIPS
jgi:hypothetical protein